MACVQSLNVYLQAMMLLLSYFEHIVVHFMAGSCGTCPAHLSMTYVAHGIKLYAGYVICRSKYTDSPVCDPIRSYTRQSHQEVQDIIFQNMMLSDNEVIKFLSVNAHFCSSPIGLNRKFFNMYKKRALGEEEESRSGLLLSLLNAR